MRRLILVLVLGLPISAVAKPNVDALWDQEGKTLRDLISIANDSEKGEALFRLGEWERASADRVRKHMDDKKEAAAKGEAEIKQHLDAAEEALSSAEKLASQDRLPHVLFSLGDLRRFRGDLTRDRIPFARLAKEFPTHPLAVDAAVALGDDDFDAGKLADAMSRYGFADTHALTEGSRAYAKYKLAWCEMNLDDYQKTRGLLLQVVSLAESHGQRLTLADEARRDFVLALARDPKVPAEKAQADIVALRLAPDRTRRYEEGYASVIAGAGRDTEAAYVLGSIEAGAPPTEAIGIFTAQLEIAIRQRDLAAAVASGRKLGATMSRTQAPTPEARDAAEKAIRVAAVTLHGEGRARGNNAMLEAALGLYEDYFVAFDATPLAYDLHHHAGELLTQLHRPAEAERHYTAAVERDLKLLATHQPAGKWLDSAALGAVNEAQDALPKAALPPRTPPPSDEDVDRQPPAETPLTDPEQVYVAACGRYLKALPNGGDAVDIAYQRALVLYRHNHLSEAGEALQSIALNHPDMAPANYAAELSMDALRLQGRYDELAKLALAFNSKRPLQERLGAELSDVHEAALLAAAAREAKRGHQEKAAQAYLDFAKTYPSSPRMDRALYNAAAAFATEGRADDAIHARDRLIRTMPKSTLVARARERQLDDLVRLGRFAEAQHIATQIADDTKGASVTDKLHDAVALSEAAGDTRGADALRTKYLKDHPRGPDAMPYALSLASHTRGCSSGEEAGRKALAFAPNAAWRAVALTRLAERENECHDKTQARAHAHEAVALAARVGSDRPDALDASADASLLAMADDMEKYRALAVGPPYERTLPKKLKALKDIDGRLAKVIGRGRADAAVCALVQSGLAYGDLAQELGRAKAPHGFTHDQRDLFKEQLAEKSQPLLDHARQALMEAIGRARDAGTSPGCLAEARHSLTQLWPERFGKQEEAVARLLPVEEKPAPEAEAILDKAPDAPAAWLIASRAELAARHPQAAIVLVDRIARTDFLFPQGLEVKAQALDALGQADAALALWVRLAKEFSDRTLAHRVLADRALLSRDFEAAREHLVALAKRSASDPDVALNLGVVLHGLGDVAGAEKALREARTLAPKRLEASLDLGLLLCGDGGRPDEGIADLEQFEQGGGRAPDGKGFEAAKAACRALAKGGHP